MQIFLSTVVVPGVLGFVVLIGSILVLRTHMKDLKRDKKKALEKVKQEAPWGKDALPVPVVPADLEMPVGEKVVVKPQPKKSNTG